MIPVLIILLVGLLVFVLVSRSKKSESLTEPLGIALSAASLVAATLVFIFPPAPSKVESNPGVTPVIPAPSELATLPASTVTSTPALVSPSTLELHNILNNVGPYNAADGTTAVLENPPGVYNVVFTNQGAKAGIIWNFKSAIDLRQYKELQFDIEIDDATSIFVGLRKDRDDNKPVVTITKWARVGCIYNVQKIGSTQTHVVIDLEHYRKDRDPEFLSSITALTVETYRDCFGPKSNIRFQNIVFRK